MYKEVVLSTSLKENTINIWDVNSCTNLFEFKENFGIKNGTALVTMPNRSSDYGMFYQSIYSIQSVKPVISCWKYGKPSPLFKNSTGERMTCLASSLDGNFLFGGSISGKMYIWCCNNGELLNVIDAHYKAITVIRCVPDMSSILTAGDDGLIRQWNYAELIGGLIDVNATIKPLWTVSDHSLGITDLAINTGMYLFSCSLDKTIRIWNLYAHRCISTISTPDAVHCLLLTHDEKICYGGSQNGSLYVINLSIPLQTSIIAGGERENTVSIQSAHTSTITTMTITGDNKNLITGSKDGSIFIWDTKTMQVLREYKGSNSSSKNSVLGKGKNENEDNSVVLLKVIPYPTLLFETDNLLYPIKALKKYKIADIKSFEPVVTRSSISEDMMKDSSSVVYIGSNGGDTDPSATIPLTSSSPIEKVSNNEGNSSEIEILRKENQKWQEIAEKLYQQVLSKDNTMEEE